MPDVGVEETFQKKSDQAVDPKSSNYDVAELPHEHREVINKIPRKSL
jgi:hypothetical protein